MRLLGTLLFLCCVLWSPHSAWADGTVEARVQLVPASHFVARSSALRGGVYLSPGGQPEPTDTFEVELTTFDTGVALRTQHMLNKYVEAGKHPTAKLSELKTEGSTFQGQLSFHGKTAPVKGTFRRTGTTYIAEFPLDITAFGFEAPTYMGVGIEDVIQVTVRVPVLAPETAP
jgi:hypothetical protein